MIRINGGISTPIRINGKINKAFPKFTVTFKDGNTTLQQIQVMQGRTATYNGIVPAKDGNAFLGWVLSEPSNPIVDSDDVTAYQQIPNVQADITCWAVYSDKRIIHDSWADISQYSQAGTAQNHYSVGDMKRIHIEGTVGTLAVNQDVYVTILGFDHNSTLEGSGITFGCFEDVDTLKHIALIDGYFGASVRPEEGIRTFNLNHWGSHNYGGWKGSDMRYDILGSTDVAPSEYGTTPTTSRYGNNPTANCTTNPVTNTLMSCLPSSLRNVMKPITKYTDNTGNSSNTAEAVTSSTDYLPLLSEFEVFGRVESANQNEPSKQAQYAYFVNENAKIKYKHSNTSAACYWWLRSPRKTSYIYFSCATSDGSPDYYGAFSFGLAPIFLV